MRGPYRLRQINIDQYVSSKSGAYCLTYSAGDKNMACYVGRSDNDLNSRLKDHLPGNEIDPCIIRKSVDKFYFQETNSTREAYDLECKWYHEYKPSCNNIHPDKTYLNWSCPVCGA